MRGIEDRARAAGDELRGWQPPARSTASPAASSARTLRRRRARRIAAGVGAVVLAAGVVSWQRPDDRDRLDIAPPATNERPERPRRPASSSTTTTAERTTGSSVRDAPGTGGDAGSAGTTTEGSGDREPASPPPEPEVRDIDFGAATYPAPCPAYDSRSVTLSGGSATVPQGAGARLDVSLGPVSYADADGDGDEDAIVTLRCSRAGADVDTGALAAAYRAGADGRPEPIGAPQALEHVHDLSAGGLTVTVTVDVYAADDPHCCPSSGAEQTWAFDGQDFRLQSNRTIPPPGAG
jgi:hypothetical protein